ncbi:MAG: hypothetical protein ACE5E2_02475 [Candidatus Binatia bacterium]
MKRLLLFFAVAFLLGSCASTQTVKEARGQGIKKMYNHPYEDVYQATLSAAEKQELKILEENKDEGLILLSHGVTLWSWGERIAVFLAEDSDSSTEVEIVSKPVVAPLNFPPDWASRLFTEIDQELGTAK